MKHLADSLCRQVSPGFYIEAYMGALCLVVYLFTVRMWITRWIGG